MDMFFLLLKKRIRRKVNAWRVRNKQKIFCIGKNKTGTTSLKKSFENFDYIVGEQDVAENLFDQDFIGNNCQHIINYCKSAEVFQDVPFSFYQVIPYLDKAFPNSKYILTIRDTPEQWYNSFVKYYSKRLGAKNTEANLKEIESSTYVSTSFRRKLIVEGHNTTPEDPFNKDALIQAYEKHNEFVKQYFKDRPNDLLIINISQPTAFQKFVTFINQKSTETSFPWENKTSTTQ